MAQELRLQPFDYIVTVVVLAVPMLIGIAFAVKSKKNNTRLEYLLGGQQMSLLPVTMSMFVTFQVRQNISLSCFIISIILK